MIRQNLFSCLEERIGRKAVAVRERRVYFLGDPDDFTQELDI
jgi:hypothetical protein